MGNKFFLVLSIVSVFFSNTIAAQKVFISFKEDGFSKDLRSLKRQLDTTVVKNIPVKLFTKWSLRSVSYDVVQGMYNEVLEGKRSLSSFRQFVHANNIDTIFLSKEKITKNIIYILTALDDKGLKSVIVDANNNRDFSDDQLYTFNLNDTVKRYPIIQVEIEYFDGTVVKNAKVPMMIDPYQTYAPDSYFSTVKDRSLDITMFKILPNWTGEFYVEKQKYLISIINHNKIYKNGQFNITVRRIDNSSKAQNSYSFSSTDLLDVGYLTYQILGFEKSILTLNYLKRNTSAGAELNTKAPPIEGMDLISRLPFSLKEQLGKYVLIDFWGSWCGPCIKAIPELRKMHKLYGQNIQFVSIAYDNPKDMNKLKALIKEHEMIWPNLFDNSEKDKSIITKLYKVQEYPTSILIDPKGGVVFRAVGEVGLKALAEYLVKMKL